MRLKTDPWFCFLSFCSFGVTVAQADAEHGVLQVNAEKLQNVQQKLEGFLAQEQAQKERAQRCFVSYLRSTYLMKNKEVFDVFQLQMEEYAQSLGLAVAPRVRFLKKALLQKAEEQTAEERSEDEEELRRFKARLKAAEKESSGSENGSEDENEAECSREPLQSAEHEDLRDADLLTVKRKDVFNLTEKQQSLEDPDVQSSRRKSKETKYKEAKRVLKKNLKVNKKVVFNEEEVAVQLWPPVQRTVTEDNEEEDEVSGINVEKARERLKREDQEVDKLEYSRKVKAKHREKRMKAKEARRKKPKTDEEEEDEVVAYLAHHSEDEFDPDSLPDPDKLHSEEHEETEVRSIKRQHSSDEDEEQTVGAFRKKKTRRGTGEADEGMALDTGLSLAEDEELVLHLLRGSM